ncbi:hypothetical protein [Streptomyces sp. CC219B]|uniref:hypothetical protein n=1 Tax=Streptomyces sp. CC219B TaxID=3044574 RepID=UPI0024A82B0C|nr:hypothetical protein [Streptomyces sp. CC219B]
MKHRGRHRRRKRGRALRGVLAGTALALTAAATMISASQATVDEDPGALDRITSATELDTLRLHEDLVPDRDLNRLTAAMGRTVGVRAVLDDADRSLRNAGDCTDAEREALPVAPAADHAYCWDAADTRSWRAGAVTTSGDADDDGMWGEQRVVLSAWSRENLSRVAFIDATDPDRLRYTWVLLAVPTADGSDYRALSSPVSGMVWYQDKLLVTASGGLYVYDLHRIQRATVDSAAVGRAHGGWSAHGARFVLPAVGAYRGARPTGLSLDRSTAPDSLVASGGDRLWRYAFSKDPDRTGLLATGRADEAYRTDAAGLAGVLSYGSRWYVSDSAGPSQERGSLWRQNASGAETARCEPYGTHRCWSPATASLSYSEATGEVWSQSGRTLFSLGLNTIDSALE